MKIYEVGGCVRDRLLGLTPKDIDYVVVGATTQQMIDLGYQKVGASFPVFLKDGCEYALARTESKTGRGYTAFETDYNPTITLEQDLLRRDLTINSMARDIETGEIIDPYNGKDDLAKGRLRHTSIAFADDPVRVLRAARFAARYGFVIERETLQLMREIKHELEFVPRERIWAEIEKGLMEKKPGVMFTYLFQVGADQVPPLRPFIGAECDLLDNRVNDTHDLSVRFVLVCSKFQNSDIDDYAECCIPNNCADLGKLFNEVFDKLADYFLLTPQNRITLLQRLRAFNGSEVVNKCVELMKMYDFDTQSQLLIDDLEKAKTVDAAAIAKRCTNGAEIKNRIFDARVQAISS